jgi:hypothetical protein
VASIEPDLLRFQRRQDRILIDTTTLLSRNPVAVGRGLPLGLAHRRRGRLGNAANAVIFPSILHTVDVMAALTAL